MQTLDIQNILAELARSIGETPKDILPIAESGSARKYFRIITDGKSLIGTFSNNVEENEAIIDDLNYFKYYFVKPHEEIDFNETRLGKDFEAFADF